MDFALTSHKQNAIRFPKYLPKLLPQSYSLIIFDYNANNHLIFPFAFIIWKYKMIILFLHLKAVTHAPPLFSSLYSLFVSFSGCFKAFYKFLAIQKFVFNAFSKLLHFFCGNIFGNIRSDFSKVVILPFRWYENYNSKRPKSNSYFIWFLWKYFEVFGKEKDTTH